MCKHIVVDAYYISRCLGVRKVSNRKNDLRGHSWSLVLVPFDRPHTNSLPLLLCRYLALFPRYCQLIPKIYRGYKTLNTFPLRYSVLPITTLQC